MKGSMFSGSIAGLAGGIVFGGIMHELSAPTPDGGQMPMMQMVAMVVGSNSVAIGWLYHMFNSAVIGAVFGAISGHKISSVSSGVAWGAAYGLFWWFLGALVIMPLVLGLAVFAPLLMEPMRHVAMGSLMGHLCYGVIMGGIFALLQLKEKSTFRCVRSSL